MDRNFKFTHNFPSERGAPYDYCTTVEMTTQAQSLNDIVREFGYFLMGCSYDELEITKAFNCYGECENPDGN